MHNFAISPYWITGTAFACCRLERTYKGVHGIRIMRSDTPTGLICLVLADKFYADQYRRTYRNDTNTNQYNSIVVHNLYFLTSATIANKMAMIFSTILIVATSLCMTSWLKSENAILSSPDSRMASLMTCLSWAVLLILILPLSPSPTEAR